MYDDMKIMNNQVIIVFYLLIYAFNTILCISNNN